MVAVTRELVVVVLPLELYPSTLGMRHARNQLRVIMVDIEVASNE
jgi:hypothetical protein